MRVFNPGSHPDIFFSSLVPCTSSFAKWTNHSFSHQTSYWNTNCQNHCPHWLWCHQKLHQYRSPIQSELTLTTSSQAHPHIQCRWNSQCQKNHGPQSRTTTDHLRNALVAQMESQNQLDIKHHLHPKVTKFPIPWIYSPMILLWWLGLNVDQKISNRLHKQQSWLKGEWINKITISTQIAQTTNQ